MIPLQFFSTCCTLYILYLFCDLEDVYIFLIKFLHLVSLGCDVMNSSLWVITMEGLITGFWLGPLGQRISCGDARAWSNSKLSLETQSHYTIDNRWQYMACGLCIIGYINHFNHNAFAGEKFIRQLIQLLLCHPPGKCRCLHVYHDKVVTKKSSHTYRQLAESRRPIKNTPPPLQSERKHRTTNTERKKPNVSVLISAQG